MKKAEVLMTFFILLVLLIGCGVNHPVVDSSTSTNDPDPTVEVITPSPSNVTGVAVESKPIRKMIFGEKNGTEFYFQSLTTGGTQAFQNPLEIVDFLDRNLNGCNLIGITNNGYLSSPLIGANGINWLMQFDVQDLLNDKLLFPPLLSPDNQKIAYLIGSGDLISGMEFTEYEYQDLIVKKVNGEQREFQLTSNGGARNILSRRYADLLSLWSPNSQWIAFSDLDSNGVFQIFVSKFDGSNEIQISHRQVRDDNPFDFSYDVAWAPSSEYLAVSFFDGSLKTEILSVSYKGERDVIEDSSPLWWVSDNELLIMNMRGVALYDIKSRIVKDIIDNTQQRLFLIGPFGSREKVGYFLTDPLSLLDSSFFVYDIRENYLQRIDRIKLPSEKTEFWLFLPDEMNGDCE